MGGGVENLAGKWQTNERVEGFKDLKVSEQTASLRAYKQHVQHVFLKQGIR